MKWLSILFDKINTRTGILALIITIVVIMVFFNNAMAHKHYHDHDDNDQDITVNVDTGTDVTEINEYYSIDDKTVAELVAKAAACDHSFYWGKEGKFQISPQVAYYDGELEACIGGAWRPSDTDVMFNFSFVPDEDPEQFLFQGGALFILD